MKHPNQDIKLGFEGAQVLVEHDLPYPTAMSLYEVIETLLPKVKAIESERVKLVHKNGEDRGQGLQVASTIVGPDKTEIPNPKWAIFQEEFQALLATEQDVPTLPVIYESDLGTEEERKALKVKGSQMGALRRLGVFRPASAPPPNAPRAERRRALKASRK